jgi:hypothetical protein
MTVLRNVPVSRGYASVSDSAITYSTPVPCGTAELRLRPQWFACLSTPTRRPRRRDWDAELRGSCRPMCNEADQLALNRRPIQVGTLAAIWVAMLTAESAGLALHVLTSIRTLFLAASARPQPQPGALAFC